MLNRLFALLLMWAAPLQAGALHQRTQDAMLHVLAHEIGHAMLREFDLPILGPEEAIADDFATIYLFLMLPDRVEAAVAARAWEELASGDTPGMFSEYRSSEQRAGRMICVLYGQDPDRFSGFAKSFGLKGDEAEACADFGPEVGRHWRRIIEAYRMPEGARVTEVGLGADDTPTALALMESSFGEGAYELLAAIDWHSRIQLRIADCDGAGWWSRNGRRITICDGYVDRFETVFGE